MRRLMIGILAGALAASVVSACSSGSDASTTPAPMPEVSATGMSTDMNMATIDIPLPEAGKATVSEAANLQVGQELMITLGSNPSTGYEWTVTSKPDAAILEPIGDAMSPADSPMPGAPGTQMFRYRGASAGNTSIELTYARPFGNEKPAQVVTINIGVA
jgi:inhibitor of cysteine peptidase